MTSFYSETMRRDPYPVYQRLRGAGPVYHEPGSDLWLVLSYEDVWRVLGDHDSFSSDTSGGGLPAQWFIFMDPPRHGQLRPLISQAFSPDSVASLAPRIRALARELLAGAAGSGRLDLAADFAQPLPTMLIAEMMGIPAERWPRFLRWSEATLDLSYVATGSVRAEEALDEYATVSDEMSDYLSEQIELRRSLPRQDLLGRLAQAEVEGARLSPDEILGFFQLLLITGSETIGNLISNTVLCLLEHPDQLARLRADPMLLGPALEEVMRFRSPVQAMFRQTTRDVEIGGQVIPAGKRVLPVIGAANRDPARFAQADRFDISRSPNPHIAFGHGIHACLGSALARLEARIALEELLKFEDLALAEESPWTPRRAFHVLGPSRLPIRFRPVPSTIGQT